MAAARAVFQGTSQATGHPAARVSGVRPAMTKMMPRTMTGARSRPAALMLLALLRPERAGRPAIEIETVDTPGGLEAWLVEDHANPMVTVRVHLHGGAALDPRQGRAGHDGRRPAGRGRRRHGLPGVPAPAGRSRHRDGLRCRPRCLSGELTTLTENLDEAIGPAAAGGDPTALRCRCGRPHPRADAGRAAPGRTDPRRTWPATPGSRPCSRITPTPDRIQAAQPRPSRLTAEDLRCLRPPPPDARPAGDRRGRRHRRPSGWAGPGGHHVRRPAGDVQRPVPDTAARSDGPSTACLDRPGAAKRRRVRPWRARARRPGLVRGLCRQLHPGRRRLLVAPDGRGPRESAGWPIPSTATFCRWTTARSGWAAWPPATPASAKAWT